MSMTTMGETAERRLREMAFRGGESLAVAAEVPGLTWRSGAGAMFLCRVRDGVLETALRTVEREESGDADPDADDRDAAILAAMSDDPGTRWEEYVQLHGWTVDVSEISGGGGDVTETVAGAALQVIAGRLFDRLWGEVREAARRDAERGQ